MNYRLILASSVVASVATISTAFPGIAAAQGAMPTRAIAPAGASSARPVGIRTTRTATPRETVIERARTRAEQEIDRRAQMLGAFATRIGNGRISDADKSSLQATMQEQINDLQTLKSQIASDASTTTLKTAIQSIGKSYRIFALVMPQGAVMAAADRVNQVAAQMQALSGKLQTRISSATGDTAALSTALSDLNAKVSDAQTQAQAAVSEVSALKPDNGDQAVFKSNHAALQDAHKKLQAAQKDLAAARHDAATIVQGLHSLSSTATSTATGTTTQGE